MSDEPMPLVGKGRNVTELVADIFSRVFHLQRLKGLRKYGTPLTTANGRDVHNDLLMELVDAFQYTVQASLEWNDAAYAITTALDFLHHGDVEGATGLLIDWCSKYGEVFYRRMQKGLE